MRLENSLGSAFECSQCDALAKTERGKPATVAAAQWVIRCLTGGASCAVPAEDLAALAAHLVVRTLPPGAIGFAPDSRPDGVWAIRSGVIELAFGTGEHRLVAQVLRDGELFGDIPLLIDRNPPFHPRAATATTCLWMGADDFLHLLGQRPALAQAWLTSCALRFFNSQTRRLHLFHGALPQRVARLLLSEARGGVVALPQATLAAMLGTPRPSLNRVLRAFERDGMISLRYRQVRLLDKGSLRRAANTD
jgi:CRP-like cAMP-binding protein